MTIDHRAIPVLILFGVALLAGAVFKHLDRRNRRRAEWSSREDARLAREAAKRRARREAARTLEAIARGDNAEALKDDALRQGLALFGGPAELEIIAMSDIATAIDPRGGAFRARVIVRMVNDGTDGQPAASEVA